MTSWLLQGVGDGAVNKPLQPSDHKVHRPHHKGHKCHFPPSVLNTKATKVVPPRASYTKHKRHKGPFPSRASSPQTRPTSRPPPLSHPLLEYLHHGGQDAAPPGLLLPEHPHHEGHKAAVALRRALLLRARPHDLNAADGTKPGGRVWESVGGCGRVWEGARWERGRGKANTAA
eukprot:366553-Chlamydomonas_euryale.AAC.19